MRLTTFQDRMAEAFGSASAQVFAQDHVLSRLGNRTVNQALADGEPAKAVWTAVWEEMRLPAGLR